MKRILILTIIMLFAGFNLFGQASGGTSTATTVGDPTADKIGVDSAQQKLIDIGITKFEDPGFWYASMPADLGMITLRRRLGEPAAKADLDKERLENEAAVKDPIGQYVLGVKVQFYKRAVSAFSVYPVRPLPIPGKSKTVSLWTIGRNFNHRLKIQIADYFGNRHELTMGKLNFLGWKKMTVAIPPTIPQSDYHFTSRMGIQFAGLKIYCDLMEAYGTFYIYFDDLSAVVDLFEEENRDEDDVIDDW
jgi:hypothetical protein